ncbi:hypothetical protein L596_027382 [Steinernema carpocapsae]|uniref:Metalloendopeptidase n=1 Tax=Steinernema carpocapsae TaxID=34508 RepID=A0A4U5M467_STECR|nr:hypothetical protein L596_027382 [Steinernema carpocapsae]
MGVLRGLVLCLLLTVLGLEAAPTLTTKDIVDKAVPPSETVLEPKDFENMPDKEVDLRTLGIRVPEDPTMGNRTEGDIAIEMAKKLGGVEGVARDAIRQTYRKWPNGEIPYTISNQYGQYARSIIAKAMQEYHTKTCLKFVARDPLKHPDYVYIHPDDGCYSLVGRTGGKQPLSLDNGCIQTGTIVHELMHSVGFFHEQSRTDRDQYIQIIWGNVMKGADDQFEKYGPVVIQDLGEPYDYSSIMHYGPYAFSDNGKKTIIALKPGADRMGQRVAFSELDLRKINKLYECQTGGNSGIDANGINDGLSGISGPVTPLKPQGPPQICEDNNWRCRFWAIPVLGYCENYEEIRQVVCPKSCGYCRQGPQTTSFGFGVDVPSACQDGHPSCSIWRQLGHCESRFQAASMQSLCPSSCGLCPNLPPSKRTLICADTAGFFTCKKASLFGNCDRHSDDCARTCGYC